MKEDKFVSLSKSARDRILELRSKTGNENKHLRIAVMGGGCSGFRYDFALKDILEDKLSADDFKIEHEKNAILAIDEVSLGFINGSEIDFVEDLGSSYFKVTNPNAKSSCGCGDSFSV
jgi:iron-sulfur cluster insertion protein